MKLGQGDLHFCVPSGSASGSVYARLQVSVYSSYDLCHLVCRKILFVHFDSCDLEK